MKALRSERSAFVCHNTERTIEMSMQSIDFNSGNYKEYAINGDENRVISINVSDVGIITRIQDAMSKADNIAEEVSEREKKRIKLSFSKSMTSVQEKWSMTYLEPMCVRRRSEA